MKISKYTQSMSAELSLTFYRLQTFQIELILYSMFDFSYDFLFLFTSVLKWVRALLVGSPKSDAFAIKVKVSYQGRVAKRGQPDALLAPDKSGKWSPKPLLPKIKFQICRKFVQITIFTYSRVLSRPLQNNRTNRLTLADTTRQGRKWRKKRKFWH